MQAAALPDVRAYGVYEAPSADADPGGGPAAVFEVPDARGVGSAAAVPPAAGAAAAAAPPPVPLRRAPVAEAQWVRDEQRSACSLCTKTMRGLAIGAWR